MGLIRYSCGHISGPQTDFQQVWALDVFHHALPINGIQNAEIRKKNCDVITSVLYKFVRLNWNLKFRLKLIIFEQSIKHFEMCTFKKCYIILKWMIMVPTFHVENLLQFPLSSAQLRWRCKYLYVNMINLLSPLLLLGWWDLSDI